MKKFLTVALIFVVMCVCGCGSNYSDETYLEERVFFVENKENIDDFMEGAGRKDNSEFDEEFLKQMLLEGRIKFSDKEVKVAVTDELRGGEIIEIKFLQGRYKNKLGYVFPEYIVDVKKERELAKKLESERLAEEARKAEEEAKKEKEQRQKEQQQIEQLTSERKIGVIQEGVQIVCVMTEGTSAYQKLIGKTNLPEGTRLKIRLASVNKETRVQNDETFSALFERGIIPSGEQNILISTLDKAFQPKSVQIAEETVINSGGNSFLGKKIYSEKISVD